MGKLYHKPIIFHYILRFCEKCIKIELYVDVQACLPMRQATYPRRWVVTALSAMLVDGPGSDFEEGLGVILTEPYTIHSVTYGSSPRRRGVDCVCVYQDNRFCSVATHEQMEHAVKRLVRNDLPIPPCLMKWLE